MRREISSFARITGAALSLLTSGWSALAAQDVPAVGGISESDYFAEMPVVLSVSRLAQPLSETPGAVTVIDRDMIRRSGAREPAELLRLVPGFLVSGFNGANPVAAYHAAFNPYGTHLQVFVDGRSVYSTYFLGDTHRGLMGVVLEDIERIEVLRGSNSAAYGANAFLGVVNIVTRHAADARGGMVSLTGGERGISDNVVRVGFGNDMASFRATLSRRADNGMANVNDDKRLGQFHLRGDLRPTRNDEVTLLAGVVSNDYGDGLPNAPENPERMARLDSSYAHGLWRRDLGRDESLQLAASYDEERYRDSWQLLLPIGSLAPLVPAGSFATVPVDFGGSSRRIGLEAQHTFKPSASLRMVWGGEYRHEQVKSPPLYYTTDTLSSQQWRWFGNVEWRPHERWLINAGGLWEHQSIEGSRWAPRLMANFHLTPDQTLRAGVTKAHRMPTLFELRGDVRYFDTSPYLAGARNLVVPPPYSAVVSALRANWSPFGGHYLGGVLLSNDVSATGGARPETLLAREVGYLGEFRNLRLTLDVRAFDEVVGGVVRTDTYAHRGFLDDLSMLLSGKHARDTRDYVNNAEDIHIYGWEYQARWQPFAGARIIVNQSFTRIQSFDAPPQGYVDSHNAPTHLTSMAWFQDLPAGFNASLMYSTTGAMIWATKNDLLKGSHQLDLRLAKSFRIGPTRGEISWTVQQANGPRQEFLPTYSVDRRAFVTLRFDY